MQVSEQSGPTVWALVFLCTLSGCGDVETDRRYPELNPRIVEQSGPHANYGDSIMNERGAASKAERRVPIENPSAAASQMSGSTTQPAESGLTSWLEKHDDDIAPPPVETMPSQAAAVWAEAAPHTQPEAFDRVPAANVSDPNATMGAAPVALAAIATQGADAPVTVHARHSHVPRTVRHPRVHRTHCTRHAHCSRHRYKHCKGLGRSRVHHSRDKAL